MQRARNIRIFTVRCTCHTTNVGLADVFGVLFTGRVDGPMQNSYPNLDADPATGRRHPMLNGLDEASRIINGAFRCRPSGTRVRRVQLLTARRSQHAVATAC